MGRPDMAAHFQQTQDIPFTLLVDDTKETYRILEIRRGSAMDVIGPKVWLRGAKNILTGKGQALPQQDPLQLGGTAVVAPGGEIRYLHRAGTSSDNAPIAALLEALE